MDNPLVNNLHSGVTQNTAATNQRGATPLSGPSPSLSTQGATSAFKSTTPAPSFSSSTPSPALTNQQHQQQQQQQPHSNSGPSFPQFPYPSTNMWHTQHQGGPVTFATQPQFTMPPRTEEGHGLGLDPGNSADLAAMVGGYDFNFAAPMDIPTPPPPFGFATTQQQQQQQQQQYPGLQQYQPSMPFQRPALALDTSSQAFQMPQQQPPSSALSQPPSGLELSGTGLESLIQPSLYLSQAMDFNNATNQHPPPMYYPGTISPSALPHQMLKPAKSFSDLLLESRQSSVSASSTEHEWNGLEDLSVPLARTLVMDQANTHHHHSQQQQQQQQQQAQQQQAQQQAQHHAQQQQQLMHAAQQQQQQQQLDIKPSMDRVLSDPSRNHLITQAIRWYMTAENRLAFGERKIIIMSPKVGQKSYGNEKRFLCPHPQATLIGKAWFTPSKDDCPVSPLLAPRVNISLSGEAVVKDGHVAWTTLDNKSLDDKIHTQAITTKDRPFLGNVAGKNLHISDMDSKRREVKALVTVKAPLNHHSGVHGWGPSKGTTHDISNERVIGVFESKEIKVISKPSKKKSNSKSAELIIQHGSTIALFNRVKSQTSSTRYLSVPIDLTRYPGSDGRPVTGAVPPAIPASDSVFRGFTVNPSVWESFIIYLVDPSKPAGPSNMKSSNSGWPNLPANIIPMALAPPVRYNSTIVLQSLQTGHISPVLVIRRGDDGSEVVGMDGTATDTNIACPEGELPGHPVSQLQKVAFEVYQPDSMRQFSRDSTYGGLWLSCDQETVREQFVSAERRWNPLPTTGRGNGRPSSMPNTPQSRFGVLPMTPHTTTVGLPSNPSSPISSSASSSTDYFGSHSRKSSSSALFSPLSSEVQLPTSTDGGPVRRQRTGSSSRGPLGRPAMHKKRASADITTSASYDYMPNAYVNVNAGAERLFWTLDVGDVCIWSIVSTEQVSYTFYVPPFVSEPTEPFAPFPVAHRLLPPNMSAEQVPSKYNHHYTSMSALPLVTFYGKNFAKRADGMARHDIYFGDKPATHNEVRCNEVMAAAEPVLNAGDGVQPVFLVRDDGQVIVPTGLKYPPTFP